MAVTTLSEPMKSGLKAYKYSSLDTSPFSAAVTHPYWDYITKFYPLWVAPNTLTFLGFLASVAHYLLLAYYNTGFLTPELVPAWAWATTAILVFSAHTLDGTDGKQARRTHSSSALGELFDHGCDAWVCLFLLGSFMSLLGKNAQPITLFAAQWAVLLLFLLSHWEKYITGVFYLPWAYDITHIAVAIAFFTAALLSPMAFRIPILWGVSMCSIIEWTLFASIFIQIAWSIWNILVSCPNSLPWHRGMGWYEAFRPLFPSAVVFLASLTWALYSPTNLLHSHLRLFTYCFSTLQANTISSFIVAQLCRIRPPIINRYIVIYSSAVILLCFLLPGHLAQTADYSILCSLAIFMTVVHLIEASLTAREIARFFNISVFHIPYPRA